MSELIGYGRRWLVAIAVLVMTVTVACSGDEDTKPEGATETNVVPAPCESDEDCAGRCITLEGQGGSGEQLGFCEQVASEDERPDPER